MNDTPSRAGRKEWVGLGVLAIACVVYAMDLTVLHLAVPQLSADLQPTSAQLLWIIDIYGFMVAGLLITMGTLGDRIGRRRLLLMGAVFFGFASVLTAFASSPEMLIAARALLGIAGATIAPSTLSLIRNMFHDDRQRTTAIGIWITAFSLGGALGPVIGGALLEFFWWGSVFLIAVPVMAVLLILGPILLPEYKDPDAGRIDLLSAALSLAAVLAVIYGLKQIAQDGLEASSVVAILVGLVIGLLFLIRQTRLDDPLIDVQLFRLPSFSASLAVYTLGILVLFGAFLFIYQYLQLVVGLSPFRAGLWTLPSFVGFIVGSMLAPVLVRWIRPALVMAIGLLFGAVGFVVMAQVSADTGVAPVVISSIIFSLGMGPLFTLTNDLIIGSAPPERAGAASGISETGAEFGGAFSIALLGTLGTAVYRNEIAGSIPAGVPAEDATAAQDTFGGAFNAAAGLPDALANDLMHAASVAFTRGMEVAAYASAAIAVGSAVVAAVFLWRLGAPAGGEAEAKAEVEVAPEPAVQHE
jgi:DHA2 family multidrug resistance protein-like MFS transporter